MDERELAGRLADLCADGVLLLDHRIPRELFEAALRAYAAGQDQSAGRLAEYLTSVGLVRFCHETSAAEYQDGGRLIITALRAYAAGQDQRAEAAGRATSGSSATDSVTGQSSAHQSTAAQELPTPTSDSAEYPTAAAYEAVCAARTKWQERAERAEAALMHAQKNYAAYSIATAQVESLAASVRQVEAERDALREDAERWDCIVFHWQHGEVTLECDDQGYFVLQSDPAEFAQQVFRGDCPDAAIDAARKEKR